jgi:glyoxylase-like metal-dependent hydrolase (beta-lactamase superfamily II)
VPIVPIDLEHEGLEGAISTYLVDVGEPVLVDPGPSTTIETLEHRMSAQGVPLTELRHVLLTHIHLDHAGATGHLVERVPGLTVHVHEDGARHLADPERLVASTRRTFGEAHDRLWGEVRPVPRDRIRAWRPGDALPLRYLRPIHTPGHIDHHVAWLDESGGTLLAGDSLGIILTPDAPSHPPTPPPSVDLAAWQRTLANLLPLGPERIGVAHFGLHEDFHRRREALAEGLRELAERVGRAIREGRTDEDARAYEEEVRARQATTRSREDVDRYFDVFRAETDYRGVERYVTRRGFATDDEEEEA